MTKLEIIKGTTETFSLEIIEEETNSKYIPNSDETVLLSVRGAGDHRILIQKTANISEENEILFNFKPDDTNSMYIGVYYYDAALQSGDDLFNIIPYSAFIVSDNVTYLSEG